MSNFDLKIEKGIPIPEKAEAKWDRLVGSMEVGDSMLFEEVEPKAPSIVRIRKSARKLGYRVITRKVGASEHSSWGTRVWRVEGKPKPSKVDTQKKYEANDYEKIIDHLTWVAAEGASISEVHEIAWHLVNATREGESEC